MDEKDFFDLLNEIDSMSVKEYNKFHKKALKMKETGLFISDNILNEITLSDAFSTEYCILENSQFSGNYINANDMCININYIGEEIWETAA